MNEIGTPLDVDEQYLWSILSDRSGIDLAEFCRIDEEKPDRCFRVRDYQWSWFRCSDIYQIDKCGRDVGKSLSINLRCMAWPFNFPGADLLLTAPRGVHLRPITDQIEYWFTRSGIRLYSEMLIKSKTVNGISRMPAWSLQFANNSRIVSRLPRNDGQGVKGCLAGGSLVLTKRGHIPIEEVIVGDEVMTHMGRWRPVLATYAYKDAQVSRIGFADRTRPLVVSQGHQLLARLYGDEVHWVTASQVSGVEQFHMEVASATTFDTGGTRPILSVGRRHQVPWYLLSAGENTRVAALETLVHEHGEVTETQWLVRHDDPAWLLGVQMLAQSCGWRAAWGRKGRWIELQLTPGQPTLDEGGLLWRKVDYVQEDAGLVDVYDIGVDEDHSYLADGFFHHNQHAVGIELDEGQDYPAPGYTEIIETMKSGVPGAQWRIHGVSRGVRDTYYKFTQNEDPNLRFKVHEYPAMYRETWSEEERLAKIALYGGTEDDVDYRRNVMGAHGDANSPLFVLARLMANVRIKETPWAIEYNQDVYRRLIITDSKVADQDITSLIEIPDSHLDEQYLAYHAGADLGFTKDPTEILVFGMMAKDDGSALHRLLLRCQLNRITTTDQASVIKHLFEIYGDRLQSIGLDRNGVGLGVVQTLASPTSSTALPQEIRDRIKGYHPTEKIPVAFEDREAVEKESLKDLVIKDDVTSWGFGALRRLVDSKSIELPYDVDLLAEFQGQSVVTTRDSAGALVRRGGSKNSLHTLDAALLWVAAMEIPRIERLLSAVTPQVPVLDLFA